MLPVAPGSDRHPGGPHDLKSAHQALPVPGREALSRYWVEFGEPLTKPGPAQLPMELDRLPLDLFGSLRNRREPVFDRPDVKPGAADKNGQATCDCRDGDLVERCREPPCGRTALGGIEKAVEPMRYPRFRDLVRARGQYAQIAIALQAVGIDDRAARRICQFECELGFSACRWPGDDQHRRFVVVPRAG
jgi:hypothetical protein